MEKKYSESYGYNELRSKLKKIGRRENKFALRKKNDPLPVIQFDLSLKDFLFSIKGYDTQMRERMIRSYTRVNKSRKRFREDKAKGIKVNYKLSPIQLAEIIELFGRLFTIRQVYNIINEEWGITYAYTNVAKLKKKYMEEILRRRNIYINDISKLRLVHKRARLEELSDMYEFAKSRNQLQTRQRILEQINKEVEKNQLEVIHTGQVNINETKKIEIDIGLENIKTLAILKSIAYIPEIYRNRIRKELLSSNKLINSDDSKLLEEGKDFDIIKPDTEEAKKVKKEKKKDKVSLIRKMLRNKINQNLNQVEKIKSDSNSREIESRGNDF